MHMVHVLKYIRTRTIIWLLECQSVTQPWGTCVHGSQGIISNFWYNNDKTKKTNSYASNGKYSNHKVTKRIVIFPAAYQTIKSCPSVVIDVYPSIYQNVSLTDPDTIPCVANVTDCSSSNIYLYGIMFRKFIVYSALRMWHRRGTNIFWENSAPTLNDFIFYEKLYI